MTDQEKSAVVDKATLLAEVEKLSGDSASALFSELLIRVKAQQFNEKNVRKSTGLTGVIQKFTEELLEFVEVGESFNVLRRPAVVVDSKEIEPESWKVNMNVQGGSTKFSSVPVKRGRPTGTRNIRVTYNSGEVCESASWVDALKVACEKSGIGYPDGHFSAHSKIESMKRKLGIKEIDEIEKD